MEDLAVPGLPTVMSAAVGPPGTVVLSSCTDPGPVSAVGGKLYCGTTPLEPAIAELTKASHLVAEGLRGRLGWTPTVYSVLIAPGARSPLFHLDVLIVAPAALVRALTAFPVVHDPADVVRSSATLRELVDAPVAAPEDESGDRPGDAAAAQGLRPMPEAWRQWDEERNTRNTPSAPPAPAANKRRGRRQWRFRRRGSFVLLFVVTGLVVTSAWYAANHAASSAPPSAPTSPVPLTDPTGATTTVPSFLPPMAYPGQEPGDVLANSAGTVELAGASVTLGSPRVDASLVGHMLLCVAVTVRDSSRPELGNVAVNWAVQSPSGSIDHPATLSSDEVLEHGRLVPGASVNGKLCFNEPGQVGLYVLSYRPVAPPRAKTKSRPEPASRGVWLLRLP
jgi:hypothetical protein